MADLALKDELTGVANRRALEERLESAVAGGGELVFVLCDIDRLKELNDAGEHEAGDRALRRAAGVLQEFAEPYPRALVARLGGDELCVLIEGAGVGDGKALAEAALAALADDHLGLSCGVAARGAAERPADVAAIEHAARALAVHCLYGGPPADRRRARAISAAARADTLA